MLDNTDFMLTMQINDPKFALQTFTDVKKYKIDVKKCVLYTRQVNVSPSVVAGHYHGL